MNAEDFVTYEQALTLKKLGFREPCLYYYHNNALISNDVYVKKVELLNYLKRYNVSDLSKVRNSAKEPTICDAPTLVQVQKWLRSKDFNLIVDVNHHNAFSGKYYWKIYNNDAEFVDVTRYGFEIFDSYEDAFSAGITVCLKLLENDKEE